MSVSVSIFSTKPINKIRMHKILASTGKVYSILCLKPRSSRWRYSMKKFVLKNFAKIQRKTPVPDSLF